MESNLYTPPKSVVDDVAPGASEYDVRFFPVSPLKLVVLSTCTLGLYQIYWFYKQWDLIKKHSEPDIIPWGRALFSVLWCYSCLGYIRKDEEQLDIARRLPVTFLTVLWIAATLSWRLPPPYSLFGFLSSFILIPVQQHINRVNTVVAPDHERNSGFSVWNWLAVVLGGLFQILIIIGLLRGPQGG